MRKLVVAGAVASAALAAAATVSPMFVSTRVEATGTVFCQSGVIQVVNGQLTNSVTLPSGTCPPIR